MSQKIQTKFAVREMKIMKDVLNKLGYDFNERGAGLIVTGKSGYSITINEEKINFDSIEKETVNKIKIEYGRSRAIALAQLEGSNYQMEETADEIIIYK
jgi:hypothetical protein